jgi:WS/DGAT/MGAT family acyltransferase
VAKQNAGSAGDGVERASPNDVMHLSYHCGDVPAQVGAILVLAPGATGGPPDLEALRSALAARVVGIRRLRQLLRPVPFGMGRPIWMDDPDFNICDHVTELRCPAPGSLEVMRNVATTIVTTPLRPDRPLWSATLVTGITGGRSALVISVHHALADGVSAVGLLALLTDPGSGRGSGSAGTDPGFPRRPPPLRRLAVTATVEKVATLVSLATGLPRLVRAARDLRLARIAPAPRCSLNRPTGPQRRLAVARTELATVRAAARTAGGSVNDAVLAVATGALHALLRERGEVIDELAVAVFVSGGRQASPGQLTNQVGVLPLTLPAGGTSAARLRRVSEITAGRLRRIARASRSAGSGTRLTSSVLLEPLFRVAGAVRLVHWYFNRQRRVNTFVTTLRGPAKRVRLLGAAVEEIVPMSNISGNVSVVFLGLSYAGSLTVTAVLDPDTCPDGDRLLAHLRRELADLERLAGSGSFSRGGDPTEVGAAENVGMQVKDDLA